MATKNESNKQDQRSIPVGRIVGIGAAAGASALLLIPGSPTEKPPDGMESLTNGCLTGPARLKVTVEKATVVDYRLALGSCSEVLAPLAAKDQRIGENVKVLVQSPSFPGKLESVSNETRMLTVATPAGQWSWEIYPEKPGDYELSVRTSVLEENGERVLFSNDRSTLHVEVEATLGYDVRMIWNGFKNFATSTVTIVGASGIVIWGAIAKGFQKRRDRKAKTASPLARWLE